LVLIIGYQLGKASTTPTTPNHSSSAVAFPSDSAEAVNPPSTTQAPVDETPDMKAADENSTALEYCFNATVDQYAVYKPTREMLYGEIDGICLRRLKYNKYFCPEEATRISHSLVDDYMFKQGYPRPDDADEHPIYCENYKAPPKEVISNARSDNTVGE